MASKQYWRANLKYNELKKVVTRLRNKAEIGATDEFTGDAMAKLNNEEQDIARYYETKLSQYRTEKATTTPNKNKLASFEAVLFGRDTFDDEAMQKGVENFINQDIRDEKLSKIKVEDHSNPNVKIDSEAKKLTRTIAGETSSWIGDVGMGVINLLNSAQSGLAGGAKANLASDKGSTAGIIADTVKGTLKGLVTPLASLADATQLPLLFTKEKIVETLEKAADLPKIDAEWGYLPSGVIDDYMQAMEKENTIGWKVAKVASDILVDPLILADAVAIPGKVVKLFTGAKKATAALKTSVTMQKNMAKEARNLLYTSDKPLVDTGKTFLQTQEEVTRLKNIAKDPNLTNSEKIKNNVLAKKLEKALADAEAPIITAEQKVAKLEDAVSKINTKEFDVKDVKKDNKSPKDVVQESLTGEAKANLVKDQKFTPSERYVDELTNAESKADLDALKESKYLTQSDEVLNKLTGNSKPKVVEVLTKDLQTGNETVDEVLNKLTLDKVNLDYVRPEMLVVKGAKKLYDVTKIVSRPVMNVLTTLAFTYKPKTKAMIEDISRAYEKGKSLSSSAKEIEYIEKKITELQNNPSFMTVRDRMGSKDNVVSSEDFHKYNAVQKDIEALQERLIKLEDPIYQSVANDYIKANPYISKNDFASAMLFSTKNEKYFTTLKSDIQQPISPELHSIEQHFDTIKFRANKNEVKKVTDQIKAIDSKANKLPDTSKAVDTLDKLIKKDLSYSQVELDNLAKLVKEREQVEKLLLELRQDVYTIATKKNISTTPQVKVREVSRDNAPNLVALDELNLQEPFKRMGDHKITPTGNKFAVVIPTPDGLKVIKDLDYKEVQNYNYQVPGLDNQMKTSLGWTLELTKENQTILNELESTSKALFGKSGIWSQDSVVGRTASGLSSFIVKSALTPPSMPIWGGAHKAGLNKFYTFTAYHTKNLLGNMINATLNPIIAKNQRLFYTKVGYWANIADQAALVMRELKTRKLSDIALDPKFRDKVPAYREYLQRQSQVGSGINKDISEALLITEKELSKEATKARKVRKAIEKANSYSVEVGAVQDFVFRAAAYDLLKDSKKVYQTFGHMNAMTPAERGTKSVILFSSWLRYNGHLWLERMAKNPGTVAFWNHIYNLTEDSEFKYEDKAIRIGNRSVNVGVMQPIGSVKDMFAIPTGLPEYIYRKAVGKKGIHEVNLPYLGIIAGAFDVVDDISNLPTNFSLKSFDEIMRLARVISGPVRPIKQALNIFYSTYDPDNLTQGDEKIRNFYAIMSKNLLGLNANAVGMAASFLYNDIKRSDLDPKVKVKLQRQIFTKYRKEIMEFEKWQLSLKKK